MARSDFALPSAAPIRRFLLAAALTAGAGLPAVGAEVYRWVDARGVVHYTQVAPRDRPFERVDPGARRGADPSFYNPTPVGGATAGNDRSSAPASAANGAARSTGAPGASAGSGSGTNDGALTPEQQARRAQLEQEAQSRLAEVRSAREENCRNAREQFRQFTTYARIRVSDGQGGERALTEDERQARIDQAQEAIVLNCEDEAG